jgi:hypothetical protein
MVSAASGLPQISAGRCCGRDLLAWRYATAARADPGWAYRNLGEVMSNESIRSIAGRPGRRGRAPPMITREINRNVFW